MNESTEIKIEKFEDATLHISGVLILISLLSSVLNFILSSPYKTFLSIGETIELSLNCIGEFTGEYFYLDTGFSNVILNELINDEPLIGLAVIPWVVGLSVKLVYHLWTDQNFFSKYIGNQIARIFWISLILLTGNILIFIYVSKLLGVVCFIGLVIFWKYLEEKWAKEDKLEEEKKEKENKENNRF